jgi:hypothetical protein
MGDLVSRPKSAGSLFAIGLKVGKKGIVYRLLERRNLYSVIDVPFCVKINFYILSIFFRFKEIIVMQMQLPSNLRDFYHRENIAIQSGVGLFYFLTSFEIQQWANDNFVSRNP